MHANGNFGCMSCIGTYTLQATRASKWTEVIHSLWRRFAPRFGQRERQNEVEACQPYGNELWCSLDALLKKVPQNTSVLTFALTKRFPGTVALSTVRQNASLHGTFKRPPKLLTCSLYLCRLTKGYNLSKHM